MESAEEGRNGEDGRMGGIEDEKRERKGEEQEGEEEKRQRKRGEGRRGISRKGEQARMRGEEKRKKG